jgi:ABC-type antimicrobial peptide transport system permease subunit
VVVVNQQAAQTLWPGQSALGRVVRLVRDGPPLEVVGVVRDSRYLVIAESPRPYMYRPLAQQHASAVYLHVRTVSDAAGLIEPVRAAAAAIDRDMAPFEVRTMDDAIDTSPNGTLIFRLGASFASVIGLLAVVLTLVGLYGVIAYSVAQRTQEIGLRMALGATQRNVVRSILADGGKLAFAGIGLGVVAAVLISRMIAPLLVGSRAGDVVIVAGVAFGLGLAALLSAYLPARRAARVDPVDALNEA